MEAGFCYIFNHDEYDGEVFTNATRMKRKGSTKDVERLRAVLETFQIKVTLFNNKTVAEIKEIMEEIEHSDFTLLSYIVVVILTHGDRNNIAFAKNGTYNTNTDIESPIARNATLRNKPKLYFIQSCRGLMELKKPLPAQPVIRNEAPEDEVTNEGETMLETDSPITPESLSETIKFYATYEGYKAYRWETYGSVFIQSLCKHLIEYRNMDIETIMDKVTPHVRAEVEKEGVTQIPTTFTTLSEAFKFVNYMR